MTTSNMRYEISFTTAAGVSGQRHVLADSDEAALAAFREQWSEYGDAFDGSAWIVGRWSIA